MLRWNSPRSRKSLGKKVKTWTSEDEFYRIYKYSYEGEDPFFCAEWKSESGWRSVETDAVKGSGYPKYYTSMKEVLVAVDNHHNKQNNEEGVRTKKSKRNGTKKSNSTADPPTSATKQTNCVTSRHCPDHSGSVQKSHGSKTSDQGQDSQSPGEEVPRSR